MKKARILLAGIAMFAIIGGAFAVKSSRATDFLYVPGDDGELTVKQNGITLKPGPITFHGYVSTTTTSTAVITTYYAGL
jgi:hypothetical protein